MLDGLALCRTASDARERRPQAKRSASGSVDVTSDDDSTNQLDTEEQQFQRVVDHSTAQHARQSRDHCKRARADSGISPEKYVAALSLGNGDGDGSANDSRNDAPHQLGLPKVLMQRGKHQEALRLLEAVLVSDPKDADTLYLRGQCLAADNNSAGVRHCIPSQFLHVPGGLPASLSHVHTVGEQPSANVCCYRHLQALLQQLQRSLVMRMLW